MVIFRGVVCMDENNENLLRKFVDSGALFFKDGLFLKDGRPSPYFFNAGELGNDPVLRWLVAQAYAETLAKLHADGLTKVFGPSYKASLLAGDATLALYLNHRLSVGVTYDRKEEKAHGEASSSATRLVGAQLKEGDKIYIVDDVGTSMKTKYDAIALLREESERAKVTTSVLGIGVIFDREQVAPVYDQAQPKDITGEDLVRWNKEHIVLGERGEDAIGDFKRKTGTSVDSLLGITECIKLIYINQYPIKINGNFQPMDKKTFESFKEYMSTYGRLNG
jgi:orotate phosphoribosyltransferase